MTKAAGLKSIARNSFTRRLDMRGGGAYQRSPRKIGRSGFQMFHIRCCDPLLSYLFTESQRLFVRYDPRNLAKVWVPIPDRGEYLAVPYADLRRPPISQSEQEAAMREIQTGGRRTSNEDAIFSTIELQQD